MRRFLLFGRSRSLQPLFIILTLLPLGVLFFGQLSLAIPGGSQTLDLEVPFYVIFPLLPACLIGGALNSPFGEVEHIASYPLPLLRASYLLFLLSWETLLLVLITLTTMATGASIMLLRNLIGYVGLSSLSAFTLGSRLAWLLPFAFFWLARLNGNFLQNQQLYWSEWAWPFQPASNNLALAQAILLGMVGIGLLIYRGAKE